MSLKEPSISRLMGNNKFEMNDWFLSETFLGKLTKTLAVSVTCCAPDFMSTVWRNTDSRHQIPQPCLAKGRYKRTESGSDSWHVIKENSANVDIVVKPDRSFMSKNTAHFHGFLVLKMRMANKRNVGSAPSSCKNPFESWAVFHLAPTLINQNLGMLSGPSYPYVYGALMDPGMVEFVDATDWDLPIFGSRTYKSGNWLVVWLDSDLACVMSSSARLSGANHKKRYQPLYFGRIENSILEPGWRSTYISTDPCRKAENRAFIQTPTSWPIYSPHRLWWVWYVSNMAEDSLKEAPIA